MRVVCAMSGGVDSSVAAARLVEAGHEVVGVTLHLYDAGEGHRVGRCCGPIDQDDARAVAARLGIPHYTFDYRALFERAVVRDFVDSYGAGETPTPCTHCNTAVKFGPLLEAARGLGAEALATGHYARVERDAQGRYHLRRGHDAAKDQTYFLFGLSQEVLARTVFPLGGWTKERVRAHARALGLPTAEKAESMEVCFVEGGSVGDFVSARLGPGRGQGVVVDSTGRTLGGHEGFFRYTVGQRRGLPIGGDGRRRFVLSIDARTATVVVGDGEDLLAGRFEARDVVWTAGHAPPGPARLAVQIRHRHVPEAAEVVALPGSRARVSFERPVRAVAPGQAAVFYDGDELVGGGWIASAGARPSAR